jgi:hypothetical protein
MDRGEDVSHGDTVDGLASTESKSLIPSRLGAACCHASDLADRVQTSDLRAGDGGVVGVTEEEGDASLANHSGAAKGATVFDERY